MARSWTAVPSAWVAHSSRAEAKLRTELMHPWRAGIVLLCSLAFFTACWGQQYNRRQVVGGDVEPWERDDLPTVRRGAVTRQTTSLVEDAVTKLIRVYQRHISPQSIDRCPFSPSCSNYALQAIHTHGAFLGLCYFIDRNLYRENPDAFGKYGLVRLSLGRLKLDDRFFLGETARYEIPPASPDSRSGAGPGK